MFIMLFGDSFWGKSLLKNRLVAALCERRRVYFCRNAAATDRRYSLKRVSKQALTEKN